MSDERARPIALGVIALILVLIAVGANPLNLPVAVLERWIERKLPAAPSIVAVRNAIEREGWQTIDEWDAPEGFGVQVLLGREWPRRRHVYAFFVFDRFGRLLSTAVRKSVSPTSVSEAPLD